MLTIIVFSKDRPLQLDLTLKSIYKNIKLKHDICVIFSASSDEYDKSYIQLEHEHPDAEFYCDESIIFNCNLRVCCENSSQYIMFLTDDNIIYKESKTTELDLGNLFSRDIACLSLRLGVNITHRDGFVSEQPIFERVAGSHIIWNRMTVLAQNYFNYPLSVDGHIFRKEAILNIVKESDVLSHNSNYGIIKNPNQFEKILQRYFFEVPALMACELQSCVVNSPNNRVQNTIQNWHGQKFPHDPNYLLELFNKGFRINLENLDFSGINCPHQEINLLRNANL